LKAKQSGIIGGIEEVSWFSKKHGLQVKIFAEDAKEIQKGIYLIHEFRDFLSHQSNIQF